MDASRLHQNTHASVVLRFLKLAVRSFIQEGNWGKHIFQVYAFAAHEN